MMGGLVQALGGAVQAGAVIGVVLSMVNASLGAVVAYIAYQGYRRNGSRPMLFVAVGFAFVFLIPFLLSALPLVAFAVGAPERLAAVVSGAAGFTAEVSRIVGLLSILYGLRMPLRG